MFYRNLLFVLVVTVAQSAIAQSVAQPDYEAFDRYVASAVSDWEVPGLAVAMVHGDRVVFAQGYGVRTVGEDDSVDVHTLFANASTTKAFVSMSVGMMVDEGRVGWDDPVVHHLPHFRLGDPVATHELTVRHLLSHRTGFGDPSYLWYGTVEGFDEILPRLRFLKPQSGWVAPYSYNNVTYATAGELAARAAGMTWEELVQGRILTPLGMTDTYTNTWSAADQENVATPHYRLDGSIVPTGRYETDNIGPAGAMYSSVLDMTKWIRMLLDSGQINGERLVTAETLAELMTPQVLIRKDRFYSTANLTHPNFTAYGMGWFLQDYRGHKVAFHTGSIDGMVAIVGLLPASRVGIVVFANRDHAELRHALMYRAFDLHLGGPMRDWSRELLAFYDSVEADGEAQRDEIARKRVLGTKPSLNLDAYVGIYADSLYGSVEVTREGDGLVGTRSPFLIADLEHWHFDTFRSVWRNRWVGEGMITFRLNTAGDVDELEIGEFVLKKAGPGA